MTPNETLGAKSSGPGGTGRDAEKRFHPWCESSTMTFGRLPVSAMVDLSWINRHIGAEFLGEKLARVQHSLAAAIDLKRKLIESLRPSILDGNWR
jgi:hypothetical protein